MTTTITLRPKALPYKGTATSVSTPTSASYSGNMCDNDNNTYASFGTGTLYFEIDNFSIPAAAIIKKVTVRIYGERLDSSSNVSYKVNFVAASDNTSSDSGKTKIFNTDLVPSLVPYYSSGKGTGSVTQTLTEEQSSTLLASAFPSLYMYTKGSIYYYEIYIDFEYEDTSKIYPGGTQSTAVYKGSTQASVYLGSTKII